MKFNEKRLEQFLNDEMFYSGRESYCLGKTMAEAGKIIRFIVEKSKEREKNYETYETGNVAMDN